MEDPFFNELKVYANLELSSKDERYTCIIFVLTSKIGSSLTHPLIYDKHNNSLYNYCTKPHKEFKLKEVITNSGNNIFILPVTPVLSKEISNWWESLDNKAKTVEKLRVDSLI